MTDSERALDYIRIFIAAGDAWKNYVPVDGELVAEDRVRIGTVEVGPGEDGMWFLDDGRRVQWFRRAAVS